MNASLLKPGVNDVYEYASKNARKVMKQMKIGYNQEEFEYEFAQLYAYHDGAALDMNKCFEYYQAGR